MDLVAELKRKEFSVNLGYLREMVKSTIRDGESLRDELYQIVERHGAKIDIRSTDQVIWFINEALLVGVVGGKITNESLEKWFEQTKNGFFLKIKQYKRCRDKYNKIATFIKSLPLTFDDWGNNSVQALMESNVKTAIISPDFAVNSGGGVSMSNPAMPFPTTEIMRLLGFNVAIRFPSVDRMIGYLQKYREIIWSYDHGMHTLICGNLLYVGMMVSEYDIFPLSGDEEDTKQHILEFNREYRSTYSSDVIVLE